jgi:hypothetical protein
VTEVTQPLPRPATLCFQRFCDVRHLRAWNPAIRKATPARVDAQGRALEVIFEIGDTLTYVLHYRYDDAHRRVEWSPGLGSRDAVRGWAQFTETAPGTCEMAYALDFQPGRRNEESLVAARATVAAFARWIEASSR